MGSGVRVEVRTDGAPSCFVFDRMLDLPVEVDCMFDSVESSSEERDKSIPYEREFDPAVSFAGALDFLDRGTSLTRLPGFTENDSVLLSSDSVEDDSDIKKDPILPFILLADALVLLSMLLRPIVFVDFDDFCRELRLLILSSLLLQLLLLSDDEENDIELLLMLRDDELLEAFLFV